MNRLLRGAITLAGVLVFATGCFSSDRSTTQPESVPVARYRTPTPTLEEHCSRGWDPQEVDSYTGMTCEDSYWERRAEADYEEDQAARAELDEDREWEEDEIYRGGPLD
jgi:hypothetical protein